MERERERERSTGGKINTNDDKKAEDKTRINLVQFIITLNGDAMLY